MNCPNCLLRDGIIADRDEEITRLNKILLKLGEDLLEVAERNAHLVQENHQLKGIIICTDAATLPGLGGDN